MKKETLKNSIPILIILVIALSLRIVLFTGINFNDDLVYVNFAHDVTSGSFKPNPYIFATRIMMIYPLAAFFYIFGISDLTANLYILLMSLGSVFLTYLIGKELFNKQTGVIAAFLLAILPLEIIYATTIVPDVPLAFFLTLSIYLFIKGSKSDNKTLCFLSGISLGLAWLIKTMALVYILVYVLAFILSWYNHKEFKKQLKPYVIVALGLISIILLEGIMYKSLGYSFLTSFNVNNEHYTPSLLGVNRDLSYYPNQLFNLNALGKYFHYLGFFFYFALLSSLLILIKKKKEAYILLIWLFPVLLFMQYGSMSVSDYVLMQRIYRFLTIISVPICLLIAYSMINFQYRFKNIANIAIILFLVNTSMFYAYNSHEYMYKSMADTKISAEFLSGLENKPIYADETTIGYYRFLLGYKRDNLRALDYVKSIEELHDSYVVVNSNRGYVEVQELKLRLPQEIYNPPKDWRILRIIKESDIDVYKNYDTTIYYVP